MISGRPLLERPEVIQPLGATSVVVARKTKQNTIDMKPNENNHPEPTAAGPQSNKNHNPWDPSAPKYSAPFPEPPEYGINQWLIPAAGHCQRSGLTAEQAWEKLKGLEHQLRRPFKIGEVESAVATAYGKTLPKAIRGERTPKWPDVDPVAIQMAIKVLDALDRDWPKPAELKFYYSDGQAEAPETATEEAL